MRGGRRIELLLVVLVLVAFAAVGHFAAPAAAGPGTTSARSIAASGTTSTRPNLAMPTPPWCAQTWQMVRNHCNR